MKHQGKDVMTVTQRIGWDPAAGQIRSWEFDSEGGFGEGRWGGDGDRWVVKHTATRPDGATVTATNIMVKERPDLVRWSSTDRFVGSESDPRRPELCFRTRAAAAGGERGRPGEPRPGQSARGAQNETQDRRRRAERDADAGFLMRGAVRPWRWRRRPRLWRRGAFAVAAGTAEVSTAAAATVAVSAGAMAAAATGAIAAATVGRDVIVHADAVVQLIWTIWRLRRRVRESRDRRWDVRGPGQLRRAGRALTRPGAGDGRLWCRGSRPAGVLPVGWLAGARMAWRARRRVGGRSRMSVVRAGAIGPGGNAVGGRSNFGAVSGPRGTAYRGALGVRGFGCQAVRLQFLRWLSLGLGSRLLERAQ